MIAICGFSILTMYMLVGQSSLDHLLSLLREIERSADLFPMDLSIQLPSCAPSKQQPIAGSRSTQR